MSSGVNINLIRALASEAEAVADGVVAVGFSKFSLLLNWARRVIAISGLPHALGLAIEAVVALSLHMLSLILSIFSLLENSGDLVQTVARAHLDHYSRGWQILLKAETLSEEALEEDKGGPNNV